MLAYPMLSDKVATTVPSFNVSKGKELAARLFYDAYEGAVLIPDLLLICTDGSKSDKGTAVAWTTEECRMTEGARAFARPSTWSIVKCEIFTIVTALGDVRLHFNGIMMMIIFSDCIPASMCIAQMEPEGESTGMWDVLTPLLNRVSAVHISWSSVTMVLLATRCRMLRPRRPLAVLYTFETGPVLYSVLAIQGLPWSCGQLSGSIGTYRRVTATTIDPQKSPDTYGVSAAWIIISC